ncbi:hypothetical protein AVEN_142633-1 [Araneus ventricosus]|uniref:Uncharacterized protein n=1 Tax=Araneus ventricosus TaxID=182803 RepID=A0A4Y2SN23_ARAVE|nr:hypothetical protein AVEN_142633-1 [Araneus ventricosus]
MRSFYTHRFTSMDIDSINFLQATHSLLTHRFVSIDIMTNLYLRKNGKSYENVDRPKSVRMQGAVGMHVPVGSPAADGVGERQWQLMAADRHFCLCRYVCKLPFKSSCH